MHAPRVPFTVPLTGSERRHIQHAIDRVVRERLVQRVAIDWVEEGNAAHEAYRNSPEWPRNVSVNGGQSGRARIANALAHA